MSVIEDFNQSLTKSEHRIISQLTTPRKIQDFLNGLPYSVESIYRCPLRVFGNTLPTALMVLCSVLEHFAVWGILL
jgi:hypothetical protein